jgi:hypothetical protein
MKITIDKTANNTKLLKLMADKDSQKALAAREAFAAFITTPILQVIESEPVIGNLFTTWTYDYGTPSSIPLAPLFDVKQADFIKVWAQSRPGGLASSSNSDVSELMVMTYALQSAVSFPLNYLRAARVDVVAAYLQRMAQEFLYKQEANSFAVLAAVAAQSQFYYKGVLTNQVIRSHTQGTVIPQDLSLLFTLMSRVNSSWVGGTPAGAGRAITTLVGSPEFHQAIRNMAFEPLNTTASTYPLGGPQEFREDIYKAVGNPSIYGMELVNVYDMGQGFPYNVVFSAYANGPTVYNYPGFGQGIGSATTAVFSPGSEQVVLGIDKRQDFLARLVETNPDDGSTLSVLTDNQWSVRSEEIGFYAKLREGRVALDGRNVVGLVF